MTKSQPLFEKKGNWGPERVQGHRAHRDQIIILTAHVTKCSPMIERLHALGHLIHITTLWGRYYNYLRFTDKKTDSNEPRSLSSFIQLVSKGYEVCRLVARVTRSPTKIPGKGTEIHCFINLLFVWGGIWLKWRTSMLDIERGKICNDLSYLGVKTCARTLLGPGNLLPMAQLQPGPRERSSVRGALMPESSCSLSLISWHHQFKVNAGQDWELIIPPFTDTNYPLENSQRWEPDRKGRGLRRKETIWFSQMGK